MDKEKARENFITTVRNSWTYGRMTDTEKERCIQAFNSATVKNIQGSYHQRWLSYHAVYNAFLVGIGYDGFNWRESE